MRGRLCLLLAGVVSLAVLATGCGSGIDASGDKGYVASKGVITLLAPGERAHPGTVSGTSLEGRKLSLDQYAGKVVVLNVWGSWCPPCRAEADDLATAARELASKGVVFLGINTRDENRAKARRFQDSHQVPYPSLFDPSGRTLLAFRGTITPNSIPSTLVIDAEGRVAASILGEVTSPRTLIDLIEDVADGVAQEGTP